MQAIATRTTAFYCCRSRLRADGAADLVHRTGRLAQVAVSRAVDLHAALPGLLRGDLGCRAQAGSCNQREYDDGRQAILERKVAKGTCVLWLSAIDLGWSNLPFRALYLPMLHQTIRYLAVRTEQRTGYTVGEVLPVPQGATLWGPDGAVVKGAPVAPSPGFYRLLAGDISSTATGRAGIDMP